MTENQTQLFHGRHRLHQLCRTIIVEARRTGIGLFDGISDHDLLQTHGTRIVSDDCEVRCSPEVFGPP